MARQGMGSTHRRERECEFPLSRNARGLHELGPQREDTSGHGKDTTQ